MDVNEPIPQTTSPIPLTAPTPPPALKKRLIDRGKAFRQSSNHVNIQITTSDSETKWAQFRLMISDWFDLAMTFRTTLVVSLSSLFYTLFIFIWAGFYMAISDCLEGGPLSFQEAFAFSLETATTVGFGLVRDDMFFKGNCQAEWISAIFFQCCFFFILNGFMLGIIMTRIQRANRRARQIVFSDKACILCLRGKFFLTLQVYDMHATDPLMNANVRLIAIFRETGSGSPVHFQSRVLRLTRPDDETGAKLWLSVPCTVFHEIDMWSPLAPPVLSQPPAVAFSSAPIRFPVPPQRAMDGRVGARSQTCCFVCGEAFGTEAGLRRHFAYKLVEEEGSKGGGHMDNADICKNVSRPVVSRKSAGVKKTKMEQFDWVEASVVSDEIRKRIFERKIEIIVLVEGKDPKTSNPTQARHSYCEEDFEFNAQHAPCMDVGRNGRAAVNLSKFHGVFKFHKTVNVENPRPFASHI